MRLTEAIDIARILGVDVLDMTSTPTEALFHVARNRMADARQRLERSAREYENSQVILAAAAQNASLSEAQQAQAREWLRLSPAEVVNEARVGKMLASGDIKFERDPETGEILGRGPWLDELLQGWQNDRQDGAHGEHTEEA